MIVPFMLLYKHWHSWLQVYTHDWQLSFACGASANLFLALQLAYTLTTSADLVSLEASANIITSDDNTDSDSLTLFYPLGFELKASLWLVLSNHMHSASISCCQMCLASAESGI